MQTIFRRKLLLRSFRQQEIWYSFWTSTFVGSAVCWMFVMKFLVERTFDDEKAFEHYSSALFRLLILPIELELTKAAELLAENRLFFCCLFLSSIFLFRFSKSPNPLIAPTIKYKRYNEDYSGNEKTNRFRSLTVNVRRFICICALPTRACVYTHRHECFRIRTRIHVRKPGNNTALSQSYCTRNSKYFQNKYHQFSRFLIPFFLCFIFSCVRQI